MHIHTTAASPTGDAMAGYQAAQTAAALRRARELSDAALRLKARSSVASTEDDTVNFATLIATNPAALSQTLASAGPQATRQDPSIESVAGHQEQTGYSNFFGEYDAILNAPGPSPMEQNGTTIPGNVAPDRLASTRPGAQDPYTVDQFRPVSFWA